VGLRRPVCRADNLIALKEGSGVRKKHNCLGFAFIAAIVTTCFGLARPSSGHNVIHKGEKKHNCLCTGVM
jgi:hypothetical protein